MQTTPTHPPRPVSQTLHPLDPRSWTVTRRDRASRTLTWVLVIVAASAVYGGIGLLRNGMGMPGDWLDNTPFTSWTWPGVFLLTTVALPQALAAALALAGNRWAALAAVLVGIGLVTWIGVQVAVLQRFFFLQPVIAVIGLLEIALAAWWAGQEGTT